MYYVTVHVTSPSSALGLWLSDGVMKLYYGAIPLTAIWADPILILTVVGIVVAIVGLGIELLHYMDRESKKNQETFVLPPKKYICPNHSNERRRVYLFWNPKYGVWQCPAGEFYPPAF